MTAAALPPPEWSHPIDAEGLEEAVVHTITADAPSRAALATRFDLIDLSSLSATVTVIPDLGGLRFHVFGQFTATATIACRRSGQPFDLTLHDNVDGYFGTPKPAALSFAKGRKKKAEDVGDQPNILDEADDPEPLGAGGTIDLGELVAQHLALSIPAYPLHPNADPDDVAEATLPAVQVENPFAILQQLRVFMDDEPQS